MQHLFHGDRHGVVVAQNHLSQRIPHQDHVDTRLVYQPGGGIVIGCQAGDGLTPEFFLVNSKGCDFRPDRSERAFAKRNQTHSASSAVRDPRYHLLPYFKMRQPDYSLKINPKTRNFSGSASPTRQQLATEKASEPPNSNPVLHVRVSKWHCSGSYWKMSGLRKNGDIGSEFLSACEVETPNTCHSDLRRRGRDIGMDYSFTKAKLPRGTSYPLKRSRLDAALGQAGLKNVLRVTYLRQQRRNEVMRADYHGEHLRGGYTSLTVYSVPGDERAATEFALLKEGIPAIIQWLLKAETERNTWRAVNHELVLKFDLRSLVQIES